MKRPILTALMILTLALCAACTDEPPIETCPPVPDCYTTPPM